MMMMMMYNKTNIRAFIIETVIIGYKEKMFKQAAWPEVNGLVNGKRKCANSCKRFVYFYCFLVFLMILMTIPRITAAISNPFVQENK